MNHMEFKDELKRLQSKRMMLHQYIQVKLEEQDYHGIADAAMDLRELDARVFLIHELGGTK